MPHYHTHLRGPDGFERDGDGLTFPDLDAAYLDVCRTIPDLAAELLRAGRDPMAFAFVIADAEDRPLMEVPFRERVRDARMMHPSDDPPEPAASCAIEQAQGLVAEVRLQHLRLQDNLARMRDLLRIQAPGSGMGRP